VESDSPFKYTGKEGAQSTGGLQFMGARAVQIFSVYVKDRTEELLTGNTTASIQEEIDEDEEETPSSSETSSEEEEEIAEPIDM
jgi:hypothetical protein